MVKFSVNFFFSVTKFSIEEEGDGYGYEIINLLLLGVILDSDGGDVETVVILLPPAQHAVSAEAGQLPVHPQTEVVPGPLDLQHSPLLSGNPELIDAVCE